MKIIFLEVENGNKEDKIMKENQMEYLQLKRTVITENFTGGA